MSVYRAGVIGCGRVGSGLDDEVWDRRVKDESWRRRPCTHAGNYAAHPRIELVAGADLNPRRLERFGQKWGVAQLYSDYEEMLQAVALDIVSIATPSELHAPMAIAAAQAGAKAIFCEKPLATSLAEADEVIQVCAERGVGLVVNHTFLFHPNMPRAKALLDAGAIGELRTVACYFPHWLIHMGTHLFALLVYFAGEPRLVSGRLDGDAAVDTDGVGYVSFQSGAYALVDGRPKQSLYFLEFMGTEGMIRFGNSHEYPFELWYPRKALGAAGAVLEQHPFPGVPAEQESRGPAQGRFVCPTALDDLVGFLDGGREGISNGQNARQAMEICMGMYHSHESEGRPIKLPNLVRSLCRPEAIPSWVLEAQTVF